MGNIFGQTVVKFSLQCAGRLSFRRAKQIKNTSAQRRFSFSNLFFLWKFENLSSQEQEFLVFWGHALSIKVSRLNTCMSLCWPHHYDCRTKLWAKGALLLIVLHKNTLWKQNDILKRVLDTSQDCDERNVVETIGIRFLYRSLSLVPFILVLL